MKNLVLVPLSSIAYHIWRRRALKEARAFWRSRQKNRLDALAGGYITGWQQWHFAWDYYGVRGIVRAAVGEGE